MDGLYEIQANLTGVALVCALAGFGLIIGVLTGLFGVGGGFLIVPLLNVFFGIKYSLAVGSSLSFMIGTGAAGMRAHIRVGNVEFKSMLILAGSAVCGALGGVSLQRYLETSLGTDGKDGFESLMAGLFVGLLLLAAWMVASGAGSARRGKALLQRLPLRPRINLPGADIKDISLFGLCLVGLFVGMLTGMLGIGGGVLFVPLLLLAVGLSPHQAIGTSLGVVLFGSIAGTIKHAMLGNVNLWIAMSLLIGSCVGVQLGVWICRRLHATRLRRYFAVLVLLVAILLASDLAVKLIRG